MAVTRWDPFPTLARFDREFDELVRRGWGTATTTRAGFVPPVEVMRRDSDVVIRLELPGIDVERDVEVEVDKGRLVIRGERHDDRTGEGSYLLRELRYGAFRREFVLPDGVTGDNVEATYDQGMLEITVKGAVQPEPQPRPVKIRTGGSRQAIEAKAEPAEQS